MLKDFRIGMRSLRFFLLFAFAFGIPALALAASPAVDVIERLHQALLETMKQADQMNVDARYKKLEPTLVASFDFERMIAVAAGSYWANATPAERTRLLDAFTKLSVTTYAVRFNGYSGERFETLGERSGPRETLLVDTRIVRPNEPPVAISYVMAERDGSWRIIDVLLDRSISELAVRRSEYNQVLRNGGPDKLAETLDDKAAKLDAE